MHTAAKDGKMAELELVAEYAPDRINETSSRHGNTPLHFAAGDGREAAVSLLLNAGANVNQTGEKYGRTPLYYASNARVKQLLIDAGGH